MSELQKYYIAAAVHPCDFRTPVLIEDADNENGTYYKCRDVDARLAADAARIEVLQRAVEWLKAAQCNCCPHNVPPELLPIIKPAREE